jgi:hypothetical protein
LHDLTSRSGFATATLLCSAIINITEK